MISLENFRSGLDAPRDLTPALVRASSLLQDGNTLVFPEGIWDLDPGEAACALLAITNHDFHHRLTALHLRNKSGITLEGRGCVLRADGPVAPLWFENCRDLVVRDLVLDRKSSFNLHGVIRSVGEDAFIVGLDPAYNADWGAWAGELFVNLPHWRGRVEVLLEWDAATGRPAPGGDNLGGWDQHWTYEKSGPDEIMVHGPRRRTPAVGNRLMLRTHTRPAPALALSGCEQVGLEGLTLRAAGGMGIIAQRCRDVRVTRCSTVPGAAGGGLYADLMDATHFANCAGTITVEDCTFTGQLDDGINIHGAYLPALRRLDAHSLLAERRHPQQAGAPVGGPGDRFALSDADSLTEYWSGTCEEIDGRNPYTARLRFREPLPSELPPGHALDNLSWHPAAVIRRNHFRHNRARGILLSSREPMLVEDNTFSVPGTAIQAAGGLGMWCESGPVRSLIIRRNRFDSCATEPSWGSAVISIGPDDGAVATRRAKPYHAGIRIENNRFDLEPGSLALHAASAGPVRWHNNEGAADAIRVENNTALS